MLGARGGGEGGGHRKVAAINQNFEGIGLKLGVLQMHEKWNLEVWFHDLGNVIQGSRLTCCWIAWDRTACWGWRCQVYEQKYAGAGGRGQLHWISFLVKVRQHNKQLQKQSSSFNNDTNHQDA